jgi:hypothetical protein
MPAVFVAVSFFMACSLVWFYWSIGPPAISVWVSVIVSFFIVDGLLYGF